MTRYGMEGSGTVRKGNSVRYGAERAIWRGTARYRAVRYSTVWNGMVWYVLVQYVYGMVPYSRIGGW